MGELIRQVLVDLMKDDLIFIGADRDKILERGSFFTRSHSLDGNYPLFRIRSDPNPGFERAQNRF